MSMKILNENIKRSDIEDLKKDFAYFTKAIRKIDSPEELWEFAKYADVATDNLQKFVDNFFGFGTKTGNFPSDLFEIEGFKDTKKIFDLILELPYMFFSDQERFYDGRKTVLYGYLSYLKDKTSWEIFYARFDRDRDKIYSNYSKILRDIFNILFKLYDAIVYDNEKGMFETKLLDVVMLDGFKIFVHYNEQNRDLIIDSAFPDFKRGFKKFISIIKEYHLGKYLKYLELHLDFNEFEIRNSNFSINITADQVGGLYKHDTNSIYLKMTQDNKRLLLHEFGHELYFALLNKKIISDWEYFYSTIDPIKEISDYSKHNAGEGFAEAFAYTLLGGSNLSDRVYAFMRNIISNM